MHRTMTLKGFILILFLILFLFHIYRSFLQIFCINLR